MSYEILSNRLKKRKKHLSKWAKRKNITSFRVYNKDLTEYPCIIDTIDDCVIVWIYNPEQEKEIVAAIKIAFEVNDYSIFVKYRGKQKGLQTQYEKEKYSKSREPSTLKTIEENGLKFELNLSDYVDTGLFLDHRNARLLIQSMSENKNVLNLFAYTGSFTCYAIKGGAKKTTTVELNPKYCEWVERNLALNGNKVGPQTKVIQDDCLHFLENTGSKFDLIICDPPTFSNSKRKHVKTFSIKDDYPELLNACISALTLGGKLFFSTNATSFNLDPKKLPKNLMVESITNKTIPEDFKNTSIHKAWILTKL
ncbi:methyltransferase [bacterium]|jgi:23S rRNA G2069 N7-methylase RlmK/C1962 C5-methylase RlmI|nr:methyltransferase [bacterium]